MQIALAPYLVLVPQFGGLNSEWMVWLVVPAQPSVFILKFGHTLRDLNGLFQLRAAGRNSDGSLGRGVVAYGGKAAAKPSAASDVRQKCSY